MARKTPPEFEVTIEHIVFGGEGMGYFDKRPVFVFGVFPGEVVRVAPIKVNGRFVKARLVEILTPSPDRIPEKESHYLTCSPWQTISYEKQLAYKKDMVQSMWSRLSHDKTAVMSDIIPSDEVWHYRNKLEFSVIEDEQGMMQLAFHKRYRHSQFYSLDSCALGMQAMNDVAGYCLAWLQKAGWNALMIKNILVRQSSATGKVILGVYTTEKNAPEVSLAHEVLSGYAVIYSDPRSPAAVTTEILQTKGSLELEEKINTTTLTYGYDSFFQVHPPAFEKLLMRVAPHIQGDKVRLLDLYSGVGTIGLALASHVSSITAVETHEQAKVFTERNARENGIANLECLQMDVEQTSLQELLEAHDVVVVDPPRAGLHADVVATLREYGPAQCIYISCNPATQARDWSILRERYTIQEWFLVDLYPQTPHVESVLILKRS